MGKLRDLGIKYGTPAKMQESAVQNKIEEDRASELLNEQSSVSVVSHSLGNLSSCDEVDEKIVPKALTHMSWIKIDKIVLEKKNSLIDNLSVLYTALHDCADTISLVLKKEKGGLVNLYLGVRDIASKENYVSKYLLQRGLNGSLPGISYQDVQLELDTRTTPFVSFSTGIPSLKNDKKEGFIQGVERLINSTANIPSFTIVFVAENVSTFDCEAKRKSLLSRYSELSEQSEITTTKTENSGVQDSSTQTNGSSSTTNESTSQGSNHSSTSSSSTSGTEGHTAAFFAGVNNSESNTEGTSITDGTSENKTTSSSSTKNESVAKTSGTNSSNGISIQTKKENKEIKEELKKIESNIERISNSASIGMWNYSTYFLAESKTTSYILACIYRGLICGEKSEKNSFRIGSYDESSSKIAAEAIKTFTHPSIKDEMGCKPYSLVDSFELSIGMSLPLTSIPGVLVKEQPSFGRNVINHDINSESVIPLGYISHLGNVENTNPVTLDYNLLTSHMFITGATGSGKSNTIYGIISNLLDKNVRCLIIEPAKGEYKNIFGGRDDFNVLGTNPNITSLLRINPFSFPDGVHVEEHIDRLIDIFNACWPMYAAMPAVLKESICRAYENCGWDLVNSTSEYNFFPSFEDVERELNEYINESEYSSDSKGDYKGALGTRLQSLSNGIVGQIFSGNELTSNELFDQNNIIDLSRIGSVETKSLIMGILVIKLNEFRMSEGLGMNLPLRHVTILEEAHNLLRATSNAQSQESANLTGKSVEMIASSIAEMRTYGEGFVIADQSPSLLDKAAICNTNTKIIMNLPNSEDKQVASSSIGLSEQQTNELSRLRTGVAVVFQKGWEEPVQCQITRYEGFSPYNVKPINKKTISDEELLTTLHKVYTSDSPLYCNEVLPQIVKSNISGYKKIKLSNILSEEEAAPELLCAKILVHYIGENLFVKASKQNEMEQFNEILRSGLLRVSGINYNNVDIFLDMYVKGCSFLNKTAFYENWLLQKTTSKKD